MMQVKDEIVVGGYPYTVVIKPGTSATEVLYDMVNEVFDDAVAQDKDDEHLAAAKRAFNRLDGVKEKTVEEFKQEAENLKNHLRKIFHQEQLDEKEEFFNEYIDRLVDLIEAAELQEILFGLLAISKEIHNNELIKGLPNPNNFDEVKTADKDKMRAQIKANMEMANLTQQEQLDIQTLQAIAANGDSIDLAQVTEIS